MGYRKEARGQRIFAAEDCRPGCSWHCRASLRDRCMERPLHGVKRIGPTGKYGGVEHRTAGLRPRLSLICDAHHLLARDHAT